MDDAVIRAMAKWPNVPAVYGWLGLDRRGRWLLKGDPIGHAASERFISRNYAADERGRWFFQNGPQRVYVTLQYAPYVYALGADGALAAHTGAEPATIEGAWLDDGGGMLLQTELGVGALDDRDLAAFSERICSADGAPAGDALLEHVFDDPLSRLEPGALMLAWRGAPLRLGAVRACEAPHRFGYVREPCP